MVSIAPGSGTTLPRTPLSLFTPAGTVNTPISVHTFAAAGTAPVALSDCMSQRLMSVQVVIMELHCNVQELLRPKGHD